ncbi:MAG: MBL fold metallo-hydrolase [Lachnospiraceae bacterium]|nr:MBL fold metallo-hydrolase [Lachnospiraceae bacterium]
MIDNIRVFTQSSIRIGCGEGVVYFDPFQMREEPHDADFILITHDHYDHFSPEDIEKVSKADTVLIAPENMAGKTKAVKPLVGRIETVKPFEEREIDGLSFETVPSYNVGKLFHPKKAGWVGYILKTAGQRIYIAGDTDATKEALEVTCDIALIPIGGTYTMDPKQAAELINMIRPKIAVPTHYGSIVGSKGDADQFAAFVGEPVKVVKKMEL